LRRRLTGQRRLRQQAGRSQSRSSSGTHQCRSPTSPRSGFCIWSPLIDRESGCAGQAGFSTSSVAVLLPLGDRHDANGRSTTTPGTRR
jgi:hypothetical protein